MRLKIDGTSIQAYVSKLTTHIIRFAYQKAREIKERLNKFSKKIYEKLYKSNF
jgi:hypothetical protein